MSERMITPNLFIAGAPKCGTSSLYFWLSDHPEVCASTPKEPFYFIDKGYSEFKKESNYHVHGMANKVFNGKVCVGDN